MVHYLFTGAGGVCSKALNSIVSGLERAILENMILSSIKRIDQIVRTPVSG